MSSCLKLECKLPIDFGVGGIAVPTYEYRCSFTSANYPELLLLLPRLLVLVLVQAQALITLLVL